MKTNLTKVTVGVGFSLGEYMVNRQLRRRVVQAVYRAKDGHIPSSLSIVDICDVLYGSVLRYDKSNPKWVDRDYFILSKGHGCVGLYVTLEKYGLISNGDVDRLCTKGGILGEHPDTNKVPCIEASTGSLGHGLAFAVGIALGLRIKNMPNKIITLLGDGECHEGSVWEAVNVAANLKLGRMCAIVDWNGSAAQLMPTDDLPAKWAAFGWKVSVVDGHNPDEILKSIQSHAFEDSSTPHAIIAKTVKGKGIPKIEGHGIWHHRIPSPAEYEELMEALT